MSNVDAGDVNGKALSEAEVSHRLEIAKRLQQLRDGIREKCGELPDSTPFIRAERDRRG